MAQALAYDPFAAAGGVVVGGSPTPAAAAPAAALPQQARGFDPFADAGGVVVQPAAVSSTPSPPPTPIDQSNMGLAKDVGLNALTGFASLPRSVLSGVDWLGSKVGLDPHSSQVLASIPNPGNPSVPLFPSFQQGKTELQQGLGITPYQAPNESARLLDAGATTGLMALGNPESIPSALSAGVVSQGVNDVVPGHPALAAGAGLLAGILPGGMARMTMPAVGGSLDPQTAALAAKAQAANIPLGLGQLSNSPFVKLVLSQVAKLPLSGAGDLREQQQGAFNNAVANTFGETAHKITPDVLSNAQSRIGGVFEKVANQTTIPVDNNMLGQFQNVLDAAKNTTTADNLALLHNNVNGILETAANNNGALSGRQYLNLTDSNSPIAQLIKNPNTRGPALALKSTLDTALEQNAPANLVDELRTAKQQYGALQTVSPLTLRADSIGNALPSTGDISPAALLGAAAKGRPSVAYNPTPLVDLGRIGQRFLKEPGDSNTASREGVMHLVHSGGALIAGALGAGGGAEALGPMGLLTPIAAVAAGRLANGLLRNPTLARRAVQGSLNRNGFQFNTVSPIGLLPLPQLAAQDAQGSQQ